MKILFVIHKMGCYGAQKIMAFLANRIALRGYNVQLLTYESMEIQQKLLPEVHHVDHNFKHSSCYATRRFIQISQIRSTLNKIKPDVIVSFLTYPNMITTIASRGMHIPIIISERGAPNALNSWFTVLRNFIYNFCDGYVFQTDGAKNYYNKRIQSKAIVIPNPVVIDDLPDRWSGAKEDTIVHIGRFEIIQKRQDLLLDAFSRLVENHPSTKLILYGDGKDKHCIQRIIESYHLDNRVILAGVTDDIYNTIKKARMFVLSSDYEGIPNALIEAMAVGLPCISTDCSPGGAAALINNMENGILVKTNNVDELSNAINFLLTHPHTAEQLGINAMKIVNKLHPEKITDKWINYIHSVILNNS